MTDAPAVPTIEPNIEIPAPPAVAPLVAPVQSLAPLVAPLQPVDPLYVPSVKPDVFGGKSADEIANDIQPVVDAVEAVVPAYELDRLQKFILKYAKGEVALVIVAATLALQYIPIETSAYHITSGILGAATVVSVVIAKNLKSS